VSPEERDDLVERAYAAFNAATDELWPALCVEDLVWSMAPLGAWPGPTEYRGYDGLVAFRRDWFDTWEEPRVWHEHTEHLTDDRTLVHTAAAGKLQGDTFELRLWQVVTFRDGKIDTVTHYFDEAEAREAAAA
jgi:ketosteroid isomerase-like protein